VTHVKGSRTRARLLDAAAREVARHGIAGAGLGAIAEAAGLRTGSVYFHFSSKDELIGAMLEEGIRRSLEYLDSGLAAVSADATPAARLRAAVQAHARAVAELADYAVVALSAALSPTLPTAGPDAVAFRALRHDYVHRWTGLVADAQRAGVLRPGPDPRLVRDLVLGAVNAAGLAGRDPDEVAAAVLGLLRLDPPGRAGVDQIDAVRAGSAGRSRDGAQPGGPNR
jgi:AcrR family transcriptional regulator